MPKKTGLYSFCRVKMQTRNPISLTIVITASYLNVLFTCLHAACSAKMDLTFLVDGSSSVEKYGAGNFQRIIEFIRGLTMGFVISRSNTRVSLIVYGTRPKRIFGFRRLASIAPLFLCKSR